MINYLKFFIIISLIGLTSCSDDSKTYLVGEDFLNLDSKLVVLDTLTLKTATIQLDSVITSSTNRILVGGLKDSEFGDLKTQSYFSLVPNSYIIDTKATYDSIALILRYDNYYYGDTLQTQIYKIHEITDKFEPKDKDQTQFYNTSTLAFNEDILGEQSFTPYPFKKDSINITLKRSFGENLFNNFQNKTVENYDDLEKIFKGITILPDNNNNSVLGFNYSSSVVRLYYKLDEGLDSDYDKYIDFNIQQIFNNISSNKTNTLLNPITDSEYILPSSKTNNQMYIQAGTSLNMRVEVPYVRDLTSLESDNGGTVINATLKMYLNPNSYNENISPIESLAVFIIDNKNRFISQYTGPEGSPIYATLSSYDEELGYDNYYSIDITSFIQEVQTSTYLTEYALLFQLPNNNQTVDKLLIYDSESEKETKMKMELTYLLY